MPGFDRQLGGEERRGALGPILEDLEDVVALGPGERGQAPVVKDEERGLGELREQPRVGAIPAGDGEIVQQLSPNSGKRGIPDRSSAEFWT
jgi:hypothetical protein